MRSLLAATTTAAALLSIGGSAGATPLAYEPFDYTAGAAVNASLNGGTGWHSAWGAEGSDPTAGGTLNVTTPGSTYSGLPTLGNAATVTPTSASTVSIREFATTGSGVDSGTLYVSMLLEKTNAGTRFITLNFRGDDGGHVNTAQRGSFGSISGQSTFSFGVPGQPATASGVSNASATPALLVARIDFNVVDGTDADSIANGERIRLYVNPTPGGAEPGSATGSADSLTSLSGVEFEMGNISAIDIGAGFTNSNNGQTASTGIFDEIRIGTTYADVTPVPEPACLAGLLIGLGVMLRRSRR